MANQIKLKRGLQKNLPSNLSEGEVVITTDTNKLYSKNGLLGSNVEVSTTEPSNSGVDVWLNPSGSTGTGDLQSQIDVLNNKLSVLQNIEVKACTLYHHTTLLICGKGFRSFKKGDDINGSDKLWNFIWISE